MEGWASLKKKTTKASIIRALERIHKHLMASCKNIEVASNLTQAIEQLRNTDKNAVEIIEELQCAVLPNREKIIEPVEMGPRDYTLDKIIAELCQDMGYNVIPASVMNTLKKKYNLTSIPSFLVDKVKKEIKGTLTRILSTYRVTTFRLEQLTGNDTIEEECYDLMSSAFIYLGDRGLSEMRPDKYYFKITNKNQQICLQLPETPKKKCWIHCSKPCKLAEQEEFLVNSDILVLKFAVGYVKIKLNGIECKIHDRKSS